MQTLLPRAPLISLRRRDQDEQPDQSRKRQRKQRAQAARGSAAFSADALRQERQRQRTDQQQHRPCCRYRFQNEQAKYQKRKPRRSTEYWRAPLFEWKCTQKGQDHSRKHQKCVGCLRHRDPIRQGKLLPKRVGGRKTCNDSFRRNEKRAYTRLPAEIEQRTEQQGRGANGKPHAAQSTEDGKQQAERRTRQEKRKRIDRDLKCGHRAHQCPECDGKGVKGAGDRLHYVKALHTVTSSGRRM